MTGDFLAEPEAVETVVAAVRPARGRLASWFVLGSNDYYAPRPLNYLAYFRSHRKRGPRALGRAKDLVAQLTSEGWEDLTNVRREVSLDGLAVELLGLDDAHIGRQDFRVAPDRRRSGSGWRSCTRPTPRPRRRRSATGSWWPGTPTAGRCGSRSSERW